VEFALLGLPADGPTLDLDHERFAYAGKFVTPRTGKAVARDGAVVGATAFNEEHIEGSVARIRYVTVRADRRGEGIGSRLLRFTADTLGERFDEVAIAVNNPVAYRACYRAGFVWTGEETGIAELRLEYAPAAARSAERYRAGLAVFADRDLPADQQAVLSKAELPPVVDCPC
jgi:GNAT superfamily N-acetyltransferase